MLSEMKITQSDICIVYSKSGGYYYLFALSCISNQGHRVYLTDLWEGWVHPGQTTRFKMLNEANVHDFGLWEETGVAREQEECAKAT